MKNFILSLLLLVFTVGLSQESSVKTNRTDNPVVFKTNSSSTSQRVSMRGPINENIVAENSIANKKPFTLANKPNVSNSPKLALQQESFNPASHFSTSFNSNRLFQTGGRISNITVACTEENPNDFSFENGYDINTNIKGANDLTVAANDNFTLTDITASIFSMGAITNVSTKYYTEVAGVPGTLIGSQNSAVINSQTVIGSNYGMDVREIKISVTPFLFAGQAGIPTKYWIALELTTSFGPNDIYWVITSSTAVGRGMAQKDGNNGWTIPDSRFDGVYIWEGICDSSGGGGTDVCSETNPNDYTFENGHNCSSQTNIKTANDITVAEGENFTLTNIKASIFANGGISNVAVNYFDDNNGIPGTLIGSEASAVIDSQNVIGSNFGLDVNEISLSVTPFQFTGQLGATKRYWVELSVTDFGNTSDVYWVMTSSSMVGRPAVNYQGGWGIPSYSLDGVYSWEGECEAIPGGVSFPNPYCGPLNFIGGVEPISLVSFAGINNLTSSVLGGTPAHENFVNIEGNVVVGNSYPISLEGNTAGPFENKFVVFIDWNQNGILDDAGEVYQISETITGSNGMDGQTATGNISVPANAQVGTTRLRVKKISGNANYLNPCLGATYGQAEDYTLNVTASNVDFVYENGSWSPISPEGICTSIDNIHIINGAVALSTEISANNITIDAGATLKIENILTFAGNIDNNGNLIFISSPSGNGELGYIAENSNISGTATVQRYMSNRRSYRLVSSPVTTTTSIHENWQENADSNIDDPNPGFGTHITGSTIDQQNGFDGTSTGNPSMFKVNVANQQFEAISNTDVNTLTAGDAYLLFVRGGRDINLGDNFASGETTLRTTGALFAGTQVQSFPEANAGDFVMFGNPYQSAVDVNALFAGSMNLNTNQYYIYDPMLAEFGAYVTVRLDTGTNTSGSEANQYLQPGQSAQVAALNNSPSVIFRERYKAPGNFTTTNRNGLIDNNTLSVQLYTTENYDNSGPVHDSFGIIFSDENENEITTNDAIKPMNFYENLAINNNGTYLSLEERKIPQSNETYAIYTAGYTRTNYTFKLMVNGLENSRFYLEDRFLGSRTLLTQGENIYNFSVNFNNDLSIATDRFSIHTEQILNVGDQTLLSGVHLFPNPFSGNIFYLNAPELNGESLNIRISDLTGRIISVMNLDCFNNIVTVPVSDELSSGVYLVTVSRGEEFHTLRVVKK